MEFLGSCDIACASALAREENQRTAKRRRELIKGTRTNENLEVPVIERRLGILILRKCSHVRVD
jgi:hypothetical protein